MFFDQLPKIIQKLIKLGAVLTGGYLTELLQNNPEIKWEENRDIDMIVKVEDYIGNILPYLNEEYEKIVKWKTLGRNSFSLKSENYKGLNGIINVVYCYIDDIYVQFIITSTCPSLTIQYFDFTCVRNRLGYSNGTIEGFICLDGANNQMDENTFLGIKGHPHFDQDPQTILSNTERRVLKYKNRGFQTIIVYPKITSLILRYCDEKEFPNLTELAIIDVITWSDRQLEMEYRSHLWEGSSRGIILMCKYMKDRIKKIIFPSTAIITISHKLKVPISCSEHKLIPVKYTYDYFKITKPLLSHDYETIKSIVETFNRDYFEMSYRTFYQRMIIRKHDDAQQLYDLFKFKELLYNEDCEDLTVTLLNLLLLNYHYNNPSIIEDNRKLLETHSFPERHQIQFGNTKFILESKILLEKAGIVSKSIFSSAEHSKNQDLQYPILSSGGECVVIGASSVPKSEGEEGPSGMTPTGSNGETTETKTPISILPIDPKQKLFIKLLQLDDEKITKLMKILELL